MVSGCFKKKFAILFGSLKTIRTFTSSITNRRTQNNMTTQEIKTALLDGENFGNEAANWYSVCKPSENLYLIVIGERNLFCKNIESAAKRISQLIKRGY